MFRTALLLLALLASAPALAAGPAERVELCGGALLGFGLTAEIDRSSEQAAAGPMLVERTMVGVAWRHDGWKLSATTGTLGYAFTGGGEGTAQAASFAIGREIATHGGTLRLELRQTILWEGESRLDVTQARVGWSLKF
jgi:hypothetical protein